MGRECAHVINNKYKILCVAFVFLEVPGACGYLLFFLCDKLHAHRHYLPE